MGSSEAGEYRRERDLASQAAKHIRRRSTGEAEEYQRRPKRVDDGQQGGERQHKVSEGELHDRARLLDRSEECVL